MFVLGVAEHVPQRVVYVYLADEGSPMTHDTAHPALIEALELAATRQDVWDDKENDYDYAVYAGEFCDRLEKIEELLRQVIDERK
jgi:hypothetical protein